MTPWLKEQLDQLVAINAYKVEALRRDASAYWPHVDPSDVKMLLDASGVIGVEVAVRGLNNLEHSLTHG